MDIMLKSRSPDRLFAFGRAWLLPWQRKKPDMHEILRNDSCIYRTVVSVRVFSICEFFMSHRQRYPRSFALLHWLLAAMIVLALTAGMILLGSKPNSDPSKLFSLRMHMPLGLLIGALMIWRVVRKIRGPMPEHLDAGNLALNLLAGAAHIGLYLLTFAMVGSGIALSLQAGLPAIVFGGQGALPETFHGYTPRTVHGIVANGLIALIVLHVLGAIYHQKVLKDGILSRMSLKR